MSVRVDSSSLISGAVVCGHRGLGVTGAVIRATTSTGTHGAGWLYDDWDNSGDDSKEFRLLIETPPSDGALFLYEDGSFSWVPVADGTRNCVGRLYIDGADQGTETNYLVSGSGAATGQLAATEAADTAAITGDVIVSGTLAATEAADVAALAGGVLVSGALAATEAADVAAFVGDGVALATAGGYDDTQNAPRKAKKLTVIQPDDSDERNQEFEALLARVKGQALDKAKSAAQAAPVATQPADIKPPRMPEIRGVEAALLRQWMPDLLSTYRATFTAELQALASAQQAAAQAQMRALQRQQYEDEEIAILAMLA